MCRWPLITSVQCIDKCKASSLHIVLSALMGFSKSDFPKLSPLIDLFDMDKVIVSSMYE